MHSNPLELEASKLLMGLAIAYGTQNVQENLVRRLPHVIPLWPYKRGSFYLHFIDEEVRDREVCVL